MCNWIYEETPNDDDILDNSVIVTMFLRFNFVHR